MTIIEDDFLDRRRKHRGATKPKLPVTQGGITYPRTGRARTSLFAAREVPTDQSGAVVAQDIPLRFADFVETAINMHDELVERLQAIIDWADLALGNRAEFDKHGARNLDGPVFDEARRVLAKAREA